MKKCFLIALSCLLICLSIPFAAFAEGASTTYTDPDYGVSFDVSDDWTLQESDEDTGYNFAYNNTMYYGTPLTYFSYYTYDFYSDLEEAEKAKYKRSDLNSKTLSISDFKEIVKNFFEDEEVINPQISTEHIDPYDYYKLSAQGKFSGYTGDVLLFVHLYDGVGFIFYIADMSEAFQNTDSSFSIGSALQTILRTANFSQEVTQEPEETAESAGAAKEKKSGSSSSDSTAWIVLVAAVVVAGGVVFLAVKSSKKKKAAAQAPQQTNGYANAPAPVVPTPNNPYQNQPYPNNPAAPNAWNAPAAQNPYADRTQAADSHTIPLDPSSGNGGQ